MEAYGFNETVIIGNIEFETSGLYYPNEGSDNFDEDDETCEVPIEIEFDNVTAHVSTDDGIITLDGKPILDSLDAWELLEREVYKQLDLNPDGEYEYQDEEDEDILNNYYDEDLDE